ncbi:hypothetical protein Tco_0775172 [Tanacetum coccineum]
MISFNNLKTDSENDNEKAGIHSFPLPKPTISYVDDLDFFKDFENEFPAIVYNDAQTSNSNYLTEQTLTPQHNNESELNDETSLSEYDEVGQNVLYFNDLFLFNVIHLDDLKSDKDNDNNKIDIIQSSKGRARRCLSWRQFILALGLHTEEEMESLNFTRAGCWIGQHPLLIARYLRRFAAGRKSEAHIFDGQFVARLAEHFRLLTVEILGGLIVIALELSIFDMVELVRLQICEQLDDTWAWVGMGPERQPDDAAGAPGKDILEEDVDKIRRTLADQREVISAMARDFSKFCTWTTTSLARMMDRAGVTYTSYSAAPREYMRLVRNRTDGASTSAAQQDQ